MDAPPAKVPTRAPAPVEHVGDLQRLSEKVADVLRRQNAELAKVSASVAEVRAEMRELGTSSRQLAGVQSDLTHRLRGARRPAGSWSRSSGSRAPLRCGSGRRRATPED